MHVRSLKEHLCSQTITWLNKLLLLLFLYDMSRSTLTFYLETFERSSNTIQSNSWFNYLYHVFLSCTFHSSFSYVQNCYVIGFSCAWFLIISNFFSTNYLQFKNNFGSPRVRESKQSWIQDSRYWILVSLSVEL